MRSARSGSKDDLNLYAYVYNDPLNFNDASGLGKEWAGRLVKLAGQKTVVLGKVTKTQAIRWRRKGENILARSEQRARQIEVGAHGEKDLLRHKLHRKAGPEARPHYKTDDKKGHTFWAVVGTALVAAAGALESTAEATETAGEAVENASEVVGMLSDPLAVKPISVPPSPVYRKSDRGVAGEGGSDPQGGSASDAGGGGPPKKRVVCTGSHIPKETC